MSLLATVQTSRKILPPRVVLYGPHKIGKTTFAANADKPIIIQTEEGSDALDVPRLPLCKTYADVIEAISALYNEAHDYRTVVIDSMDWLEPLIFAHLVEQAANPKIKGIEDFGYGKGYVLAGEVWREFLAGLDALRNMGMAVLVLGHCEIKRFDNPETDSYDRYQPKLHKVASAIIQEWADCIFFANFKTFVTEKEVGFNKERSRAIGTGERVVNTQERPSFIAGNRYSLPAELPLSWPAFIAAMSNSLTPKAATSAA